MALTNTYVQTYGQLGDFFKTILQGQAPPQFTIQHLKDLGYASSNHRALIPLLKALGFLTAEGEPTQRYHDYRDASRAPKVMGDALKEAYADLFVLRSNPAEADRPVIQGKFKSTHNSSDHVADLMTKSFYSLLALADLSEEQEKAQPLSETEETIEEKPDGEQQAQTSLPRREAPGLNYNIQIHLPATKDIEVYNAIFKSLREHLVD